MIDEEDVWITTEDNPYDPFTQMDLWMKWDYRCGYNTCDKIARLCGPTGNLTEYEEKQRVYHSILDLAENGFVVRADGEGVSRYHVCHRNQTTAF